MIIDFKSRVPYKSYLSGDFVEGCSIFPKKVEEDYEKPEEVPALDMGCDRMDSARKCDLDLYFKEMAEAGIDMAVIHGRNAPLREHIPNDEIAELVNRYPNKFIGFGSVDLTDIPKALDELDRMAEVLHLTGVTLEPGYFDLFVDDERFLPLYDKCVKLGLHMSFTNSIFLGSDMTYSHPVHLQRVANTYKDTMITISHGSWPYVQEMLGMALKCQNVYLYPDFYSYIPNMPFADEFIKAANFFMKYRMMFASGYPVRSMIQAVEQVGNLPLDEDVRPLFMSGNACRLLNI